MKSRFQQMMERHEGRRKMPYMDSKGNLTVGIGHKIEDNPLPDEIVDALFQADVDEAIGELDRILPFWRELAEARRDVLVSMVFNMGTGSFLTFHKFMRALLERDFEKAADEMLDSKWHRVDVGARAVELAEMMRTGAYAE